MIWKIEDISVSNNRIQQHALHSILGSTYSPQNFEATADITIRFRDYDISVGNIEEFENAMKNMIINGEKFTPEEIEQALQEKYPERFI